MAIYTIEYGNGKSFDVEGNTPPPDDVIPSLIAEYESSLQQATAVPTTALAQPSDAVLDETTAFGDARLAQLREKQALSDAIVASGGEPLPSELEMAVARKNAEGGKAWQYWKEASKGFGTNLAGAYESFNRLKAGDPLRNAILGGEYEDPRDAKLPNVVNGELVPVESKKLTLNQLQSLKEAERAHRFADNLEERLPTSKEVRESTAGGIARGVGQAASVMPLAAAGPAGIGGMAAMNFLSLYNEGYDDAIASGADDETAKNAAIKYASTAAPIDTAADVLFAGKLIKALGPIKGGVIRRSGDLIVGALSQGGSEVLQGIDLNAIAGGNPVTGEGYDKGRPLMQGAKENFTVGAGTALLLGGGGNVAGSIVEANRNNLIAKQRAAIDATTKQWADAKARFDAQEQAKQEQEKALKAKERADILASLESASEAIDQTPTVTSSVNDATGSSVPQTPEQANAAANQVQATALANIQAVSDMAGADVGETAPAPLAAIEQAPVEQEIVGEQVPAGDITGAEDVATELDAEGIRPVSTPVESNIDLSTPLADIVPYGLTDAEIAELNRRDAEQATMAQTVLPEIVASATDPAIDPETIFKPKPAKTDRRARGKVEPVRDLGEERVSQGEVEALLTHPMVDEQAKAEIASKPTLGDGTKRITANELDAIIAGVNTRAYLARQGNVPKGYNVAPTGPIGEALSRLAPAMTSSNQPTIAQIEPVEDVSPIEIKPVQRMPQATTTQGGTPVNFSVSGIQPTTAAPTSTQQQAKAGQPAVFAEPAKQASANPTTNKQAPAVATKIRQRRVRTVANALEKSGLYSKEQATAMAEQQIPPAEEIANDASALTSERVKDIARALINSGMSETDAYARAADLVNKADSGKQATKQAAPTEPSAPVATPLKSIEPAPQAPANAIDPSLKKKAIDAASTTLPEGVRISRMSPDSALPTKPLTKARNPAGDERVSEASETLGVPSVMKRLRIKQREGELRQLSDEQLQGIINNSQPTGTTFTDESSSDAIIALDILSQRMNQAGQSPDVVLDNLKRMASRVSGLAQALAVHRHVMTTPTPSSIQARAGLEIIADANESGYANPRVNMTEFNAAVLPIAEDITTLNAIVSGLNTEMIQVGRDKFSVEKSKQLLAAKQQLEAKEKTLEQLINRAKIINVFDWSPAIVFGLFTMRTINKVLAQTVGTWMWMDINRALVNAMKKSIGMRPQSSNVPKMQSEKAMEYLGYIANSDKLFNLFSDGKAIRTESAKFADTRVGMNMDTVRYYWKSLFEKGDLGIANRTVRLAHALAATTHIPSTYAVQRPFGTLMSVADSTLKAHIFTKSIEDSAIAALSDNPQIANDIELSKNYLASFIAAPPDWAVKHAETAAEGSTLSNRGVLADLAKRAQKLIPRAAEMQFMLKDAAARHEAWVPIVRGISKTAATAAMPFVTIATNSMALAITHSGPVMASLSGFSNLAQAAYHYNIVSNIEKKIASMEEDGSYNSNRREYNRLQEEMVKEKSNGNVAYRSAIYYMTTAMAIAFVGKLFEELLEEGIVTPDAVLQNKFSALKTTGGQPPGSVNISKLAKYLSNKYLGTQYNTKYENGDTTAQWNANFIPQFSWMFGVADKWHKNKIAKAEGKPVDNTEEDNFVNMLAGRFTDDLGTAFKMQMQSSILSNTTSVLAALATPDDNNKISKIAESYGKSFTGIVAPSWPTFLAKKVMDSANYNIREDREGAIDTAVATVGNLWEDTLNTMTFGLTGTEGLTHKTDIAGNPLTHNEGRGPSFEGLLSAADPFGVSNRRGADDVNGQVMSAEMMDLFNKGYKSAVRDPFNGEIATGVKVTAQEKQEIEKRIGQRQAALVADMIGSDPTWSSKGPATRAYAIQRRATAAKEYVVRQFIQENYDKYKDKLSASRMATPSSQARREQMKQIEPAE